MELWLARVPRVVRAARVYRVRSYHDRLKRVVHYPGLRAGAELPVMVAWYGAFGAVAARLVSAFLAAKCAAECLFLRLSGLNLRLPDEGHALLAAQSAAVCIHLLFFRQFYHVRLMTVSFS